jgi:hypothetical protein
MPKRLVCATAGETSEAGWERAAREEEYAVARHVRDEGRIPPAQVRCGRERLHLSWRIEIPLARLADTGEYRSIEWIRDVRLSWLDIKE